MKINKILLSFFFIVVSRIAYADPIEEGKTLFMTRCAACHNVNQVLTGPALAGVDQRRSIDWIINFVHSSRTMVAKGDKDAVAIFEKFNKVPMPDHPDLTDENIKQIVEYIKTEAKPLEDAKTPFARPRDKKANVQPLSGKDSGLIAVYILIVITLITVLLFVVHIDTLRRKKKNMLTA